VPERGTQPNLLVWWLLVDHIRALITQGQSENTTLRRHVSNVGRGCGSTTHRVFDFVSTVVHGINESFQIL
jgi:hypothetical protein